ncbi:ferric-dicitrate binding protein FerR, regulates iron transport through sigma-19 [Chitinophaga eiseniae]|uniref:Ferric-dicitrate binding protein FerR, regulates iron transport through sigma-19 n=1 Tax=Chitinophaga eiseniae TaxID=634771 RepID=A0A1T4MBD3_9BACT|nr:FecR family protein [Chitinophaga eiseniae]SJZ64078.1 ferric-dicitrate binding protein FerR, regulates iron transport through sigma-19 [Chitinophaga eiseniae]
MDEQNLYVLLQKYSQGACTEEELNTLEGWYITLGQDLPDEVIDPQSEAARQLTRQQLLALRTRLAAAPAAAPLKVVKRSTWRKVLRYAAVWTCLLTLAGAGYWWYRQSNPSPAATVRQYAGSQTNFDRYLTLPDGSTVVLHHGSRLVVPEQFNGPSREVTLLGEAYFDIRSDSAKPFVINTGQLKTTVLGTAFNISAYPEQPEITVSVTRGKVKVEDGSKVLAVLTPDQQIVYNTRSAAARREAVNAAARASWTTNEMVFENATFETIANTLSKRYEVNIQFSDDALKQCPVRVSFAGTESLEEVLDVICGVRNATYKIENGRDVLIKGKGC